LLILKQNSHVKAVNIISSWCLADINRGKHYTNPWRRKKN